MTVKKSFFILLRLIFVVFSLLFIKDAFYKWDGYSYYMRFRDFLPDLSLAFLLWSLLGVICSSAIALFANVAFRSMAVFFRKIRLADIVLWFLISCSAVIIKASLFTHISLTGSTGLSHAMIVLLGLAASFAAAWSMRVYNEKILYEIDGRITPLVWLFVFFLIIAALFSFVKSGNFDRKYEMAAETLESHEDRRPNIILVVMDALTAEDMGLYGYERATTPFISEWAEDAAVFSRAYSPSNWTSSSVMSIMTGQRVWTHKVWHFIANRQIVEDYPESLPAVLKDNGYDTYAFVQNPFAHPEKLGLNNAFIVSDKWHTFAVSGGWWFDNLADYFVNRPVVTDWIFEGNIITNMIDVFRPPVYTTLVPSERVYNRFLEFLSKRQSGTARGSSVSGKSSLRPFFAVLHVYPPHDPYLPPKPFVGMFGDSSRFTTQKEQKESNFLFNTYGPESQGEVDILRKRYDEFVAYSDFQFRSFVLNLAEKNDMSNTIMILTADHGESFSHGWVGHGGHNFFESTVHVPLIIKLPLDKERRTIDSPVSLDGIAPTILDLIDVRIPDWMEGKSFSFLLKGEPQKTVPILSMWFGKNRGFGEEITKGTIAAWDGDFKLIYNLDDNKKLLYDLRADPSEMTDIFNENPEMANKLLKFINDGLHRDEAGK